MFRLLFLCPASAGPVPAAAVSASAGGSNDERLKEKIAELEAELAQEKKAVASAKASALGSGTSDYGLTDGDWEAEAMALRTGVAELEAALSRERFVLTTVAFPHPYLLDCFPRPN